MRNTTKFAALGVMNTLTPVAFAHEGHGFSGLHWHASDAWGFVALAVAVAAGIYFGRGKK